MTKRSWGIVIVVIVALGSAANAAPVARTADLTLTISITNLVPLTFTMTGATVTVDEIGGLGMLGQIALSSGAISLNSLVTVPVTTTTAVVSLFASNIFNLTGAFSIAGAASNIPPSEFPCPALTASACVQQTGLGGPMGIGGTIWVHIPGGVLIPIPLTTAGVGVGGRNFPSGFTFDAAPWTLETGSVKWTTATFSTVTLPGGTQVVITNTFPTSSTRMGTTSAAGSQLTLVNPTYVVGVGNVLPVFTDFEIRFTDGLGLPEFLLPTPPNQGPVASCVESVNPSGKKTPPAGSTTLPGSQGGKNDDGFYELVGEDAEDGTAPLFVTNASGSATFGPFASGSVVKITEAPGATPTSQSMGGPSSAVAAHVKLDSDAFVFAVDSEGEVSPVVSCLVPPLPK